MHTHTHTHCQSSTAKTNSTGESANSQTTIYVYHRLHVVCILSIYIHKYKYKYMHTCIHAYTHVYTIHVGLAVYIYALYTKRRNLRDSFLLELCKDHAVTAAGGRAGKEQGGTASAGPLMMRQWFPPALLWWNDRLSVWRGTFRV